MRKKLIPMLCAIFLNLFFFSCSNPILPKRVEIKGGTDLPVRVGITGFSTLFVEAIQNGFSSDGNDADIKVYNVAYDGQTVQTFCIYFPLEVTEDLNPNVFLETVNKQINNGISTEPRQIGPIEMSVSGGQIPISSINLPTIGPVYLDDIAEYVNNIKFNKCKNAESGIGINFYLEEVIDGLEMAIKCDELNFSSAAYKPLQRGDNFFGNNDDLTLALAGYKNKSNSLVFTMQLQSAGPNKDKLEDLMPGKVTIMKGEVRFFQNWTEATIDMKAAIKAAEVGDEFVGTFPNAPDYFDLSGLRDFLDGEFTFGGLEAKMYMNSPVDFQMHLALEAQYTGKDSVGLLYDGDFDVDKKPFVLNSYLKNGNYPYKHLPGLDDGYNDNSLDEKIIADIFGKMPDKLILEYKLKFNESQLTIIPEMFRDSGKHGKINMILLIMMPLRLIATTDRCVVKLPDMFKKSDDLFGRNEIDENGHLFGSSVEVKHIKMTINFLNPIFSGGCLFIDGDKNTTPLLFYPDGIRLSEQMMMLDFTDSQIEIIQTSLIKPNFWVKLNKGNTVTVPKNIGLSGIKFEINAIINIGELL